MESIERLENEVSELKKKYAQYTDDIEAIKKCNIEIIEINKQHNDIIKKLQEEIIDLYKINKQL